MRIEALTLNTAILETERTFLLEWSKHDASELCRLHSASEAHGSILGEAPWSLSKALGKLAKYQQEHAQDGTGKYKIIAKEDGRFLGRAGVSAYDRDAGEFELGYVLKKAEWGKGILQPT